MVNALKTIEIGENDFKRIVQLNNGYALIEFIHETSSWCTLMLYQLQKYYSSSNGFFKHYRINIEKSPNLKNELKIKTIPKYLLFKNQKLISTFSGLKSFEELNQILGNAIEISNK